MFRQYFIMWCAWWLAFYVNTLIVLFVAGIVIGFKAYVKWRSQYPNRHVNGKRERFW